MRAKIALTARRAGHQDGDGLVGIVLRMYCWREQRQACCQHDVIDHSTGLWDRHPVQAAECFDRAVIYS
jgi:hypothetical protein